MAGSTKTASMLKRVNDRGATLAWCPARQQKNLVAAASKEGAGGGFDNYEGQLELFKEGGMPAFGTFLLSWILVYTFMWQE